MQIIETLKNERGKLTGEYKQTTVEYKSEIRRIDTALRKFRQGIDALDESAVKREKRTVTDEIEKIIREFGPAKVRDITQQLHARGFAQTAEQTVSGILQRCTKAGKRFVKIAPATYALLQQSEPEATAAVFVQPGGGNES